MAGFCWISESLSRSLARRASQSRIEGPWKGSHREAELFNHPETVCRHSLTA